MYDAFGFGEVDHVLLEWHEGFLEVVRKTSGMVSAEGGGRIAAGRPWAGTTTGVLWRRVLLRKGNSCEHGRKPQPKGGRSTGRGRVR